MKNDNIHKQLLLIDDSVENLNILSAILEEKGYTTLQALDGIRGLEIAGKARPDLILLDIMMPGMDGFEVCQRLHENEQTKNMPVIFVTAATDVSGLVKGFQIGAVDYITKPFKKEEVLARICLHLDLMTARTELEQRVLERTVELAEANNSLKTEIRKQQLTEATLRESESRYRTIFENITGGLWIHDFEGNIIDANSIACQMVGENLDELIGDNLSRFSGPETIVLGESRIEQIIQHGVLVYDSEIALEDGTRTPINVSAKLVTRDGGGLIQSFVCDITERKRSEEALKKSEGKYEDLYDNAPDMFVSVDAGTATINQCNMTLARELGYSKDELIGQPIFFVYHPDSLEEAEKRFHQFLETGEIRDAELQLKRKDGSKIDVSLNVSAVRDEQGNILYSRSTWRNIAERKSLEKQLLHAQKMEAIGQLAGGVAHDFNNLLGAIVNFAYIIKHQAKENDLIAKETDHIVDLSIKGSAVTSALLAFSRKEITNPVPLRLNESMINMEKLLVKLIGEDIKVSIKLSDANPVIKADSVQIDQIIMNLATNARDAMPDGGSLAIESRVFDLTNSFVGEHGFGKPGKYAFLSVKDTGTGMDEDIKSRVFEPFFTTKEVGKGTGLGLSIIYGIVKEHNGFIDVDSEKGRGTSFKIYFPLTEEIPEKEKTKETVELSGSKETILFADDNESIRLSSTDILTEHGYNVIDAVNGKDAVEKFMLNKDKIQLLIIDVLMPEKSGMDAYEEIKKVNPAIKAFFTSGYPMDYIKQKGLHKENSEILIKPLMPSTLLKKVKEAIHKTVEG